MKLKNAKIGVKVLSKLPGDDETPGVIARIQGGGVWVLWDDMEHVVHYQIEELKLVDKKSKITRALDQLDTILTKDSVTKEQEDNTMTSGGIKKGEMNILMGRSKDFDSGQIKGNLLFTPEDTRRSVDSYAELRTLLDTARVNKEYTEVSDKIEEAVDFFRGKEGCHLISEISSIYQRSLLSMLSKLTSPKIEEPRGNMAFYTNGKLDTRLDDLLGTTESFHSTETPAAKLEIKDSNPKELDLTLGPALTFEGERMIGPSGTNPSSNLHIRPSSTSGLYTTGPSICKTLSDEEFSRLLEGNKEKNEKLFKAMATEHQAPKRVLTRVEVITGNGREFTKYAPEGYHFTLSYQDDNRTLKLFLEKLP